MVGVSGGLAAAMFRGDAIVRAAGAGKDAAQVPADELAREEDYWSQIQRAFDIDRTRINFNNGGVSPCPTHVLDQMIRDLRFSNELPVAHMWEVLEPRLEAVRRDLAREFGCDTEEIAITRNASEGLETLIFGIDLERGDEVIVTDQNYGRMLTSWDQRVRRDGIVLKSVSFPTPLTSSASLVEPIRKAITPRTRVIELPHIINLTGQILPIREVMELAKPLGIEVFVDGAHAFAHFPFKRDDLQCDYYASSLHKWLMAPIGTGLFYVRKNKIKSIWPLMGASAGQTESIRKYEEIGTHPAANHNAIGVALAFHRTIGIERKSARLRFLRNRWIKPLLASSPRVKSWTPIDDDSASCGITLVNIDGVDPNKLSSHLLDRYGIVVTPVIHKDYQGIRVTPSIYASLDEIDLFGEVMLRVVEKGLS